MSTDDVILLTGAGGFVGFAVLLEALKQGHNVRCVFRSQAKADIVLNNKTLKALNCSKQLSTIFVPDFLAPRAFDEAVRDVKYIIHVASPVPTEMNGTHEDYDAEFIRPAVEGTLAVFEAAAETETVKRIVLTSSIMAIRELTKTLMEEDKELVTTADSRLPDWNSPLQADIQAYPASKVRIRCDLDRFERKVS